MLLFLTINKVNKNKQLIISNLNLIFYLIVHILLGFP
jgi:hypothetical protein